MISKQKYTPVRFSHLTSYASIGSIIRGTEDKLMAVVDIRFWTDKQKQVSADVIPYVTRVCNALNVDKVLRMPPKATETNKGTIDGIYLPAVLFPTYAKCEKCGILHNNPWRKQDKDLTEEVFCEHCGNYLEQITWCAISNLGFLDDVPWHYICHLASKNKCEVDFESTYLKLETNVNGKKIIRCSKCKASHNFENIKINIINKPQPWIYEKTPKLNEDDIVEILEVNNPGVYLPERANALVIPPESRISKTSLTDRLFNNSKLCREIDKISNPLLIKGKLKMMASDYRCSVKEIENALKQIKEGYPFLDDKLTIGELREDEYKAFLTPLNSVKDDEDFVTVHKTILFHELKKLNLSQELNSIINLIDKQIIVKRLREIRIFKGFYRSSQEKSENLIPPDIVGESNWLPAIELFGEGIFFTLNEDIISKWENLSSVTNRARKIAERYEKSDIIIHQDIVISPRFILLHTLSHLLIKELESTAGYPAASLKEKIYCSKDRKMAGILIYTAVADIVGSLGGIIESAEPKEFLSLLDGVFKHAQWCSLDPVCTEHEGQGPGWLNRAACHACTLIPEPSCEYNNVFLDRVFIKGSESMGIPNILDFISKKENL